MRKMKRDPKRRKRSEIKKNETIRKGRNCENNFISLIDKLKIEIFILILILF